jgi:hypothetical protein
MLSQDLILQQPTIRPFPVTCMALFQFAKAAFLLLVAALPLLGHEGRLAYIPDLRDLVFVAAHGKDPHGLLLLFFGIYAAAIGIGLWRLKRWARNSLVFTTGLMLVLWLSHLDFGTDLLVMPAISQVEQQTVYIVLLLDFAIFAYLKFHAEIAQSFRT